MLFLIDDPPPQPLGFSLRRSIKRLGKNLKRAVKKVAPILPFIVPFAPVLAPLAKGVALASKARELREMHKAVKTAKKDARAAGAAAAAAAGDELQQWRAQYVADLVAQGVPSSDAIQIRQHIENGMSFDQAWEKVMRAPMGQPTKYEKRSDADMEAERLERWRAGYVADLVGQGVPSSDAIQVRQHLEKGLSFAQAWEKVMLAPLGQPTKWGAGSVPVSPRPPNPDPKSVYVDPTPRPAASVTPASSAVSQSLPTPATAAQEVYYPFPSSPASSAASSSEVLKMNQFAQWLKDWNPELYELAVQEMPTPGLAVSGLGGIDDNTGEWDTGLSSIDGMFDDFLNTVQDIGAKLLPTYYEKRMIDIQIDRAKKGLPPAPTVVVQQRAAQDTQAAGQPLPPQAPTPSGTLFGMAPMTVVAVGAGLAGLAYVMTRPRGRARRRR